MSDLLAQHSACLTRLFDRPNDVDVRDEMLVIGDALEAQGHPLGRRVALSESIHSGATHETRSAQRHELDGKAEQREDLYGRAASLVVGRTLRIAWRGGVPYAALLNTRHMKANPDPRQAVSQFLAAPIFARLRRLTIRTSHNQVPWVTDAILNHNLQGDLEELIIGERAHPTRINTRARRIVAPQIEGLQILYPRLWLLALEDRASSLFDNDQASHPLIEVPSGEYSAPARLVGLSELLTTEDITQIGRCLWSPELRLRVAALRIIARRGLSGRFASSIKLILRPSVCDDQDEMIRALEETRGQPLCESVLATLATISGSTSHYGPTTRSLAGAVLGRLRKEQATKTRLI